MKRSLLMALIAAAALLSGVTPAHAASSPAPAPAPSAPPEDAALTAAAKTFYASLVSGAPDRAHMSSDLNNAMTDDLTKTLSQQLTALGKPTWTFLRIKPNPNGPIAQYKLTYANGVSIYYSYGATPKGTVFAAFLGNRDQ